MIIQKEFALRSYSRGFHIITKEIIEHLPEMAGFNSGLLNIFIKHTSASLTINENADPDVRTDFETHFNVMVPESGRHYLHTAEGPDDMTSHIKASLLGQSVIVPVTDGRLNLGTWQGIYLCEHRNHGGRRELVLTLIGEN
ncbi:MAG: YjbQ family protein [Ignavibacteria bacterium]|nr:YjbQ family protein [Ignavibacteria bacterium]